MNDGVDDATSWYYMGDDFPMYQIVYPSKDGEFPWHPNATDAFRAFQPILGDPPQT